MKIFSFLQNLMKPAEATFGYKTLLLILSLSGVVIVLLSTSLYGAAVSPDSIYYISAARNIIAGNGLVSFYGTPFIAWPPLYPIVLAIPGLIFHTDPLSSASVINAIIFGLTTYFTGLLFARYLTSSPVYAFMGVILVMLSNILQDLATKAWSENLFILLTIITLLYLEKYMLKRTWSSLIILSISAGCAYLTRFIGVSLIMSGAITLFLLPWDKVRARFKAAFIFTSISSAPIAILIVRNYFIDGTPFGNRTPGGPSFSENLELLFSTLINWGYFPTKSIPSKLFFLFLFTLLVVIFISFLSKSIFAKIKFTHALVNPVTIFILLYLSFLLYTTSSFVIDPISERFVSPIYIPVTLLFLVIIDLLLEPARGKISIVIVNAILVSSLTIWVLSSPLKGTIRNTRYWMKEGTGGYTSNEWRNSELIKYIQSIHLEPGQVVYSNEGEILYILTNIICDPVTINITRTDNKITGDKVKTISDWNIADNNYFIWFSKYPDSCPYSKNELDNSINLIKIKEVSDGTVYSLKKTQ
jgi:hypothetical protein